MSNLDKLLKLYLYQELNDNTSIEDVYTNKQNLFNNELFDDGKQIANVKSHDINKLTNNILSDYNYAKVSEPEIFDSSINKKIRDVKCETDTDNCLNKETGKVLAYEYSVNPPPNCNDRILRLFGLLQIIINQTNKYKKKLFEYDLVLTNLDINRGTSLTVAKQNNERLYQIINDLTDINLQKDNIDKLVKIINNDKDMRTEIDSIIDSEDNMVLVETKVEVEPKSLFNNIAENFDDDKKLLDALITVQKSICDGNLSKSMKRLNLIGISNENDDSHKNLINKLLVGREEIRLNLV